MSTDPQRVQTVFGETLQKPESERAEFLERECAGDSELRHRVEALIEAHDHSGSFLDYPPKDLAGANPTIALSMPEQAGSLIGPFKLLQQIGEGGMGSVYMAEQIEPVERRVALKIIKPGMDTKAVIARFEAERQALAMMDHPNIAKVLDVGTTNSGRPYFVMELVRGVPITQYCDEHHLTPRLRLELFLPVCQAVQHAHQKGIIHRDIKPSNVLVAEYDDRPVPKIIDFGLAKAMEKRLTAKTMFTEFGQVVGTPDYMSPEQAKLNQMDIDTRSDIYSLGVLLYELLSGNTPFDRQRMRTAAFDELLRIIREEDPPKPSQRLSTVDTLPSIAANRHITPAELTRQLSGELDWIVMKSLEKDRTRRYDTVNGLASDLRRYLNDEPVKACPPSTAYKFRKFAKRNKKPLAGLGVAATMLLVAAVFSLIAAGRFRILARHNAQLAWEKENALAAETQSKITATDAKRDAELARDDALNRLFDSLLSEARASRWSRRPGQRIEAEAAIAKAAVLFEDLELDEQSQGTLRNEVIAAMSLADIRCVETWSGLPRTNTDIVVSNDLRQCAMKEFKKNRITFVAVDDLSGAPSFLALPSSVTVANVSPDFDWVVTFESQRTLLLNRHSGMVVARFPAAIAHAHDFSSDGRLFAIGDTSGKVSICDLATGKTVSCHDSNGSSIKRLKFRPDCNAIAVASDAKGIVVVRDVMSGDTIQEFVPANNSEIWSIAWDIDGQRLAAGYKGEINLWDLRQPERPPVLMSGHEEAVNRLQFHPDGELLASNAWDGTTRIWEGSTGFQLLQTDEMFGGFSPDGRHLMTRSGLDLKLWEVVLPTGIRWPYSNQVTYAVSAHSELDLVAIGFADGVRLFDVRQSRQLGFLPLGLTRGVKFHSASGRLLTASASGLHSWPLRRENSGNALQMNVGPPEMVDNRFAASDYVDVDLSVDGKTVLAQRKRRVYPELLTANEDSERPVSLRREAPRWVAVSPDGVNVACGSWGHTHGIVIWDAKTAKRTAVIPTRGYARPAFSSDNRWLAVNSGDAVSFHEIGTWREVYRYPAAGKVPPDVAFSHDSHVAAMGRHGRGLDLIDMRDGKVLARLETIQRRPDYDDLCFTFDGGYLVASRGDAGACIWDLRKIRQRLRQMELDWNQPPIQAASSLPPITTVEIDMGRLLNAKLRRDCRYYLRAEDWDRSLELADKALTNDAQDADALRLRAQAKLALGQFEDAVADYKRSLQFAEPDARTCNELAWQIVGTGRPDGARALQAVEWAELATSLDVGNAPLLNTLGVAYYRVGRWQAAIDALEEAEAAEPDRYRGHNMFFIAMAHWNLGDHGTARRIYADSVKWMLRNSPDDDELQQYLVESSELLASEDSETDAGHVDP